MLKREKKQSRLVIGLEERNNDEEQSILEIAYDLDIWSPLCPTREDLRNLYKFPDEFPKNINFDVFYLFSCRESGKLFRLKEEISRQEINCFISSIF